MSQKRKEEGYRLNDMLLFFSDYKKIRAYLFLFVIVCFILATKRSSLTTGNFGDDWCRFNPTGNKFVADENSCTLPSLQHILNRHFNGANLEKATSYLDGEHFGVSYKPNSYVLIIYLN